jgi:hypothetical protein
MKIDMSEFITRTNEPEQKFYTKKGEESFVDEDKNFRSSTESPQVYAKAIRKRLSKNFAGNKNLAYAYYIKSDPSRNLFNPMDLYSIEPKVKKSFINKVCKTELVFTEVTESIFNKYLTFLRTENIKWLQDAQREIK